MAGSIAPNTVTDGLVLALDAANPKSYPGSGTVWTDLSGNANSGSLINGPTFDSNNLGSIVFDGVNDYVECGNDTSLRLTTELTLESWVKKTTTNNYHHIISKFDAGGSYSFGSVQTSGYLFFIRSTNGTNQGITDTFDINICDGNWKHIVCSYNSTTSTLLMAINGAIQQSTISGAIFDSTVNVNVGRRTTVGQYYTANIAYSRIYNRALTAQEILQNYNATKGKFI